MYRLAALLLALTGLPGMALAQQVNSAYTDLDLAQCSIIRSDDFGTTWACPGHKGMPVMVAERDLRMFVSFGLTSTTEKAAKQTLPPFNHLGPKIEWRISNREGAWKPFATIHRVITDKPDESSPEGQVLVITKVAPGATCHVAYVDALANGDANSLARETADEMAPGFDCADEPKLIGEFKLW